MPQETIAFFEVNDVERRKFENCGCLKDYRVKVFTQRLSAKTVAEAADARVLSVFTDSLVTSQLLDQMPQLKLVATRSTGFDHIDIEACKSRGIAVAYVPTYGEDTVAEHTFALLLSISRKIYTAYARTQRGNFSLEGLRGFDLQGKTLGVVGTGRIGLRVIKIAKGFGMNVIASDPFPNSLIAEILGFQYVPFEDLLKQSDIITLHAPYNPKTHHMINNETIHHIKRGAVLINTARGALVDTNALANALDEGILSGAGLDVLEGEKMIKEELELLHMTLDPEALKTLYLTHVLMQRDNVVITPHIGFDSNEAVDRIIDTTVDNICGFLSGQPCNLLTPKS